MWKFLKEKHYIHVANITILDKSLTLKVPEKLQLYGLYVYYVVHICDFGMLRVKQIQKVAWKPGPSFMQKDNFCATTQTFFFQFNYYTQLWK